jgi:hypothetical protein
LVELRLVDWRIMVNIHRPDAGDELLSVAENINQFQQACPYNSCDQLYCLRNRSGLQVVETVVELIYYPL